MPKKYSKFLSKVDLGTPSTMEGVSSKPSNAHGWYYQKEQMMADQAGMIARYHVIGQYCTRQPQRNGKLTGITGV